MGGFHFTGSVVSLLIYAVGLLIAYLVIKAAVRNGIDESDTGRKLLGKSERGTTRQSFED